MSFDDPYSLVVDIAWKGLMLHVILHYTFNVVAGGGFFRFIGGSSSD